jgi:imidazoleglycerol-phosphate dehydratase
MARRACIQRQTRETAIDLELDLDRSGDPHIDTNLPILSHFVSAFALHSGFFLRLSAQGDVEVDAHHLVEDVGIVLGEGVREALGDRRGIARFGQRLLPMDDALVLCAIDLSGRGQCFWSGAFPDRAIGAVGSEVWPEFFNGFARSAGATLHMRWMEGANAHHVYEACFKGFGRALAEAVHTAGCTLPSTKGVL